MCINSDISYLRLRIRDSNTGIIQPILFSTHELICIFRSVRFQLQFKWLWSKVMASCLPTDRELLRCLWMLALVLCRGRQQHQDLLSAEATVLAFTHRTRRVFEDCFSDQHVRGNQMVLAWRLYVSFELSSVCRNYSTAKKLFGRALQRCPWSKKLWLDCVRQMRGTMSSAEMNNWIDVALQKKIRLRSIPNPNPSPSYPGGRKENPVIAGI